MPTYQELEKELADDLIRSIRTAAMHPADIPVPAGTADSPVPNGSNPIVSESVNDPVAQLDALLNAVPYYSNMEWMKIQRGAMSYLLATNLPVAPIAAHPREQGGVSTTWYRYEGPYPGYREAFYSGIKFSSAAIYLKNILLRYHPQLDGPWWGRYGVAILADAIRKKIPIGLNAGKLDQDLNANFDSLKKALAASYLSAFVHSYPPTAEAFNAIEIAERPYAAARLCNGILNGQFTANLNQILSMGGEYAVAATWFLFNLWITLTALDVPYVDNRILQFEQRGLRVPQDVGAFRWWTGGFVYWFPMLTGADADPSGNATITAPFPEEKSYSRFPRMPPTKSHIAPPNGYSESFCHWGNLNWYR